ncbi:GldG family protein [Thiocystis violacea]|uniref:GldG family protein n=1 Tax=Thiocystis violacea TaxID=13725 RepID=UPI001904799E|nr:GldG family protein [Thiocystis violacea]MBK1720062.1 ABC transporter [Thiocystis violacea]
MNRFLTHLREVARRIERPFADTLFVLLLLGVVITSGWLIARNDRYWDWTASASNLLSPESRAILERLEAPLRVTVFADPQTPLARAIGQLIDRYGHERPDLEITYLDPRRFPEQARDADVSLHGQILLEYRGRRETLREIGERAISAAIARLTETRTPWLAVIEGHGERAIAGERDADLGRLGMELSDQGFLLRPLDLASIKEIPDNARLVVLPHPKLSLFPGEAEGLTRFLDRGGNLLWLLDPEPLNGLEPLLEYLGLTLLPGVVVDAAASKLGLTSPAAAVIAEYPDHPLTRGLSEPAMLTGSLAFDTQIAPGWTLSTYLTTGPQSWNETGAIEGRIDRDEVVGELAGPLPVALALTRTLPDSEHEQRVLIVGDGDFLGNAHLGQHGNRQLGLQMLRWLNTGGELLELPPLPSAAEALELDTSRRTLLGVGSLVLFPAIFLIGGLAVRWYRWRER